MPNVSKSTTKELSALIAEIEAEAYARGRADARKELLDVLAAGGGHLASATVSRERRANKAEPGKRRASGGKRAPRGSVRRFVEQALRDHPDSTVQEILERAATDTERSIKLPSIRNELQTGRRQGKYESNGRRWSLAGSDPGAAGAGETASSEVSPASEPDQGESKDTLGLTW